MSNGPSFLPPIVVLPLSWEDTLALLYQIFEVNFKRHRTTHDGLPVLYDTTVKPDGEGKEEGFWHAISRDDYETGDRLFDPRRAERLCWARQLMESPPSSEIRTFDYDHGARDAGVKRYIWLHRHDYVLVLKRKGGIYYWVTAFYITSGGKRADIERRYQNRI